MALHPGWLVGRLLAADGTFETFSYRGDASGVTLLGGGTPVDGVLRIPKSIPGVGPVTAIGAEAYFFGEGFTELVVPGSVTAIGTEAFYACVDLRKVTLGEGVRTIGDSAFSSCEVLVDLQLPGSLASIGFNAFEGCIALQEVQFPTGLQSIGPSAFTLCKELARADLPESLASLGDFAFNGTRITSVTLPKGLQEIGDYALASVTNCIFPGGPTPSEPNWFGPESRNRVTIRFPISRLLEWGGSRWAAAPNNGWKMVPYEDGIIPTEGVPVAFRNGTPEVPGQVYGPGAKDMLGHVPWGPLADTNQWIVLCYSTSTNLPYQWTYAGASQIGELPGIWRPKPLRLPGIVPGQHVALMVGALGTLRSDSPIDGMLRWRSSPFDYVHVGSPPDGSPITNFRGLDIPSVCVLGGLPPKETFEVAEDGFLEFPDHPGDMSIHVVDGQLPNIEIRPLLGSLETLTGGVVRYTPHAHTYGDDVVYRYRQGEFCDPPMDFVSPSTIRIVPSSRRPYLTAMGTGRSRPLVLRGLAGRAYTIQRSTDLTTWTPWADVVGNTSEVPLPDPVEATSSAVFLRCVEKAAP